MNFTKSELEMLYQYAAPTKEETLAGLKEIVPVLERKDDLCCCSLGLSQTYSHTLSQI